jgi:hypothetical protein
MEYSVENPTSKKKAVRAEGGLKVIGVRSKATVDAEWSDAEVERYEAAGLKVKKTGAEQKRKTDTASK